MTRPGDWTALGLSQDPTPGDPVTIRDLANKLLAVAENIRTQNGRFQQIKADEIWDSEAAEGFKEMQGELPPELEKAATRYDSVADALFTWESALGSAQWLADDALRRANDAREDLAYANSGIEDIEDWKEQAERTAREHNEAHPGEPPVTPERWSGTDFYALRRDAEDRLRVAKDDLGRACGDRDRASDETAGKIDDASHDELENKPPWRKFLLALSDIVGILAAVIGILAIFFPVLAPLALALAVLSLLLTAVLVATGDKTWTDLALEVIGIATLGLGRIASLGVRAYRAGRALQVARTAAGRVPWGALQNANRATALRNSFQARSIFGRLVFPGNGKWMSGARLKSNVIKRAEDLAAAATRRAQPALDDLHEAAAAYDKIKYPAKGLEAFKNTFKNPLHTASHAVNELVDNARGVNGAWGVTEVGAEAVHVGIAVNHGIHGITGLFGGH